MAGGMSVLVTGAASGIGAGLSRELARAGHHVVVSDLRHADCREVAEQIRALGGSAEAVELDVTSDASVAAALTSASRPIDVLVNDAGLQHVAPIEEFPMVRWDYLIQVMLIGSARLTRALLPAMRERRFGRIVNIGSIHSLVASPNKSAYVAAKHGLIGLTRTIALETAGSDITINTAGDGVLFRPLKPEAGTSAELRDREDLQAGDTADDDQDARTEHFPSAPKSAMTQRSRYKRK